MNTPRFSNAPQWATERTADSEGITYTREVDEIQIVHAGMQPTVMTVDLIEHHNIDGSIEWSRVGWSVRGTGISDLDAEPALAFAKALERAAQMLQSRP